MSLLAILFATFVSEDLTCIAAGLLIARGDLPMMPAMIACALGIYLGDLGLWMAGRALGTRVLAWPRVSAIVPARNVEHFGAWLEMHARSAIIGSRFAPGTRLPLYIAAGASRSSFVTFAAWSLAAVGLWTPLLVGLSATLGDDVAQGIGRWIAAGRIITTITGCLAVVTWRLGLRLASQRGRQRAAAALARLWRWEFWPMWLFYLPVALWTAYLAMRYRGYRTVTAANPGMPDGGVVGESKFEILSRLPAEWIISSAIVDAGSVDARIHSLAACMRDRGWAFPLVLKPDVGQRGTGVRLARTAAVAADYLTRVPGRVLVQPYDPGPFEAGVFYYRMPGSRAGRILAITDKHFPILAGDGASTIEDLVWAHPRYRMQARTFVSRFGDLARRVPTAGERVTLGIAGNHAQGTMFKDGRAMITPALEARIDAIAREYDGFFIGRFDIRYRDRAAFMNGDDLVIVELNGATAECTNIYDPDRSLLSAYRQLFLQWSLVFAIGAANRRHGRPVSSAARLLELLRAHLSASTPFAVSD
jgi:membrane protein DedA with SNARE-associated domain